MSQYQGTPVTGQPGQYGGQGQYPGGGAVPPGYPSGPGGPGGAGIPGQQYPQGGIPGQQYPQGAGGQFQQGQYPGQSPYGAGGVPGQYPGAGGVPGQYPGAGAGYPGAGGIPGQYPGAAGGAYGGAGGYPAAGGYPGAGAYGAAGGAYPPGGMGRGGYPVGGVGGQFPGAGMAPGGYPGGGYGGAVGVAPAVGVPVGVGAMGGAGVGGAYLSVFQMQTTFQVRRNFFAAGGEMDISKDGMPYFRCISTPSPLGYGHNFYLTDVSGNQLCYIQQDMSFGPPHFHIYLRGALYATLKQDWSPSAKRFELHEKLNGEHVKVTGDWFTLNFAFTRHHGRQIGEAIAYDPSANTYDVIVAPGEDALCILAAVLVIEKVAHEHKHHHRHDW